MIHSKKGIGIGQAFIFIIAIITFAVILIFGYNIIQDFIDKGEQVEFAQFKNSLESSVKRMYTRYGSVNVEKFYPPINYEKICFVDLEYSDIRSQIAGLREIDPAAALVWEDALEIINSGDNPYNKIDQNVFLQPPSEHQIKVYKLEIEDGYVCGDINKGKFSLRLEGKGDRTNLNFYYD